MTSFMNEKQIARVQQFGTSLAWGGSMVGPTRHPPVFHHERTAVAIPGVHGERGVMETRTDHAEGFVVDVYDDLACALILDHSLKNKRGEPTLVYKYKASGQAAPRVAAVWGEADAARELLKGMLSDGGRPVPGEELDPHAIKAQGLAHLRA